MAYSEGKHTGRWPRLGLLVAGAALLLGLGCREVIVLPPELPATAQPLAPLSVYEAWWRATEECAGLTGNLSRVRWFVVPESDSFTYRGGRYDGYWWDEVHWITLASAKVQAGAIVRHEMLHDLLGRGDHPAEFFQRRCGTVVYCNQDCRADE
jgi:hypothetical protein